MKSKNGSQRPRKWHLDLRDLKRGSVIFFINSIFKIIAWSWEKWVIFWLFEIPRLSRFSLNLSTEECWNIWTLRTKMYINIGKAFYSFKNYLTQCGYPSRKLPLLPFTHHLFIFCVSKILAILDFSMTMNYSTVLKKITKVNLVGLLGLLTPETIAWMFKSALTIFLNWHSWTSTWNLKNLRAKYHFLKPIKVWNNDILYKIYIFGSWIYYYIDCRC